MDHQPKVSTSCYHQPQIHIQNLSTTDTTQGPHILDGTFSFWKISSHALHYCYLTIFKNIILDHNKQLQQYIKKKNKKKMTQSSKIATETKI